jgi:hypothetical protein
MKLIRSLIDSVTGRNEEKPWTFEPMVPERKAGPQDERRAAEQAKQLKLGYSVEIVNKGEGVRYTEGLRYVDANISWANGAKLWLSTMAKWTKPDTRDLTPAEYAKILQRICEYLSCDGTAVALIDQTPPLQIEETVVAESIVPRITAWRRLERDGKLVEERQPPAPNV